MSRASGERFARPDNNAIESLGENRLVAPLGRAKVFLTGIIDEVPAVLSEEKRKASRGCQTGPREHYTGAAVT